MAITLDCPRCKQALAIPARKSGGYVSCPRCNGRFWVPENAAEGIAKGAGPIPMAAPPGTAEAASLSPHADPPRASASAAPLAIPPSMRGAVPPGGPAPVAFPPSPPGVGPITASPPAPSPPAPGNVVSFQYPSMPPSSSRPGLPGAEAAASLPVPKGPSPARKVARFIATDPSSSALKLAEDGKLPELHLKEGTEKETEKKSSGMNPLVLGALLGMSVLLSIGLVLLPTDNSPRRGAGEKRSQAWYQIEREYFSHLDPSAPLEPYQKALREARLAATRGDRKTEVERYRKVLEWLRVERGQFDRGLTGSRSRDMELEQLIVILMGSD